MVLSLLEGLAVTKGLKEALPFLVSAVEENPGLSARSLISQVRAAGLSFSDQPAFNIIAQLKANVSTREAFKLTEFNRPPSPETLQRAISPLSKNYSFLVEIRGYNAIAGARESRHVTVVSDTILTPEQVIETALSFPKDSPGSQALTNSTVEVLSGTQSPFAP